MGEVYVGYDETLHRQVALKSIRAGHRLSEEVKARFVREARILSRLDHPNICKIHDFIAREDRDFLVLELVQGRNLMTAISEGIESSEKLRVARKIADALVAAHSEGVVHRDLKPENVMLTESGEVKVLDFGLAAAESSAVLSPDFDILEMLGRHRPPDDLWRRATRADRGSGVGSRPDAPSWCERSHPDSGQCR